MGESRSGVVVAARRGTALLFIFLLFLATALTATPAAAAKQRASQLDRSLARIVRAEGGPPGVAVMIKRPGKTAFLSRGNSNVAKGTGFRPNLQARLASMAKAYNGAVILALVDRGTLRLDDTVGEWLPGLWPQADAVTIAQLLGHTSGLPEYIHQRTFINLLQTDPAAYRTPEQLIGFVNALDLDFPPGSKYSYSDSDNIVAGLIAEAASGRSYQRLLRRVIYRPLKLRRTSLPDTVQMPRPYIHGYDVTDEGIEDVSEYINPALAWASGGMVSTPREVGRFFRAYVGGKLFSKRTRRQQRNFVPGESSPPGPGTNQAGAALFRYETRCGTVFGHSGSFPGYRQFAASSKDGKRSVVFMVNAQIVPGQGSAKVSTLIRQAQTKAVCRALRSSSRRPEAFRPKRSRPREVPRPNPL